MCAYVNRLSCCLLHNVVSSEDNRTQGELAMYMALSQPLTLY